MTVLITGGLGFIGSHTVVELMEQGQDCLIVDNLSKSTPHVLNRIESIVQKQVPFIQLDLLDKERLKQLFKQFNITSVVHFAGYKSVSESISEPLIYYQNNIICTLNLLEVMQEFHVKKLVFSSSATVYGDLHVPPLKETLSLNAPNPYGRTKLMLEEIIRDFVAANDDWSIAIMRYFNPIGAHKSGLLGEAPFGLPNNLMPHILKAANKEVAQLQIFGGDYETIDGTCIRDFIHIIDLANGHVQALQYIDKHLGCEAFNLGTGEGYSVLQLIETFERVNGISVPYKIVGRREGDIKSSIADVSKAYQLLQWEAHYNLQHMCADSWKWYLSQKESNNETIF